MGCCKKENLEISLRTLTGIQFLTSFICLVLAGIIAADQLVRQGIGANPGNSAGVIAFLSALSMVGSSCGKFGARSHNKFCLLTFIAVQVASSMLQLILTAAAVPSDNIPQDFQKGCSKKGWNATCADFLSREETVRLRTLWKQVVDRSQQDSSFLQLVETVQTEGSCCGFEPPYSCTNEAGFVCGAEKFWFNATTNCDPAVEIDGSLYFPGCPYSLPGSTCFVFDYPSGCVYYFREFLLQRFLPLLEAISVMLWVNVAAATVGFALFLKRKNHDILPTAYIQAKRPKVVDFDWDS